MQPASVAGLGQSLQIIANEVAAAGLAQLLQCLRFDLTDALAGELQRAANLCQRLGLTVTQAKAHANHFLLTVSQLFEQALQIFPQRIAHQAILRRSLFGFEQVA